MTSTPSVNAYQEGGSHYARGGAIQHWDYVELNGLGYLEGCATKYVTRWRTKHPTPELRREDLRKSRHYVVKLIDLATPKTFRLLGLEFPLPGARRNRAHKTPVILPSDFAAAYELTADEQQVIALLHMWTSVHELQRALNIIDRMLATSEHV